MLAIMFLVWRTAQKHEKWIRRVCVPGNETEIPNCNSRDLILMKFSRDEKVKFCANKACTSETPQRHDILHATATLTSWIWSDFHSLSIPKNSLNCFSCSYINYTPLFTGHSKWTSLSPLLFILRVVFMFVTPEWPFYASFGIKLGEIKVADIKKSSFIRPPTGSFGKYL